MKDTPTQLDMRENTASSRRHASRLFFASRPVPGDADEENPVDQLNGKSKAAQNRAATVGEVQDESQLMTVREVAELLRVPVSWVYGRTRGRAVDRIPGFRLGKYWRFNAADVTAWIRTRRTNHYHYD
jgi:excisionase family DNA binding protein